MHFARGRMKDGFLNSKVNKQHFIHYLGGNLDRAGCIIDHHANDDADVFISIIGVASARHKDSVLIGDDTDVLVLLILRAEMDAQSVFLKSEPEQS